MESRAAIGVRYCGGCNPRYDRVALVKKLESFFPGERFAPAQPGAQHPAVVAVCGCPNKCVNLGDLALPEAKLVWLSGWEDLLPAKKKLAGLLALASEPAEARGLTRQEVLDILPHRPPMLFVDTVTRLVPGVELTAQFLVQEGLALFAGHFPGEPVFPGVCTVEALAQAADILLLAQQRYAGRQPLLAGIRKAVFHRRVLPGDTLTLQVCVLEERPELGSVLCRGQALADGQLCAEAELRLALR